MTEIVDKKDIKKFLIPITRQTDSIKPGQNILFDFGNRVSLMKFERFETGPTDPLSIRVNRHTSIYCMGNILIPSADSPLTHENPQKRIDEKARAHVLGTHRIDFEPDPEFDIYLPSAEKHTDLYLDLANKFADGRIEKIHKKLDIMVGDDLITKRLNQITRPKYFKKNITPFLESRATNLEMPGWKEKKILGLFKIKSEEKRHQKAREKYDELSNELNEDNFIYIGCKEEVFLLGPSKEDNLYPDMQEWNGRKKVKPILFFSNNYLGNLSRREADKPLFKPKDEWEKRVGGGQEYRYSDIPGFDGIPFIFSAIGRIKDCGCSKNNLFTGEPELITGNLDEALEHFETTDFSEFKDIVTKYAKTINFIHPCFRS